MLVAVLLWLTAYMGHTRGMVDQTQRTGVSPWRCNAVCASGAALSCLSSASTCSACPKWSLSEYSLLRSQRARLSFAWCIVVTLDDDRLRKTPRPPPPSAAPPAACAPSTSEEEALGGCPLRKASSFSSKKTCVSLTMLKWCAMSVPRMTWERRDGGGGCVPCSCY